MIELNVPCDELYNVTSLVRSGSNFDRIELTFSVALRRGFKKAGPVLSDNGDSWDKDFLNPITLVYICITGAVLNDMNPVRATGPWDFTVVQDENRFLVLKVEGFP